MHTGIVGSVQSLFVAHGPHVSVAPHTGVGFMHCVLLVHCTHFPLLGSVALVAQTCGDVQSLSLTQAPQLFDAGLQIGVAPEQSAFVKHSTHLPGGILHAGSGAAQSVVFVHVGALSSAKSPPFGVPTPVGPSQPACALQRRFVQRPFESSSPMVTSLNAELF
jgi:hypothetical protein